MKEFFIEKHYTLDRIPKYRLDFIEFKLGDFISQLKLTALDWPLDCVKLLERVKKEKILPLDYEFKPMDKNCDGAVKYFPEEQIFRIYLNSSKGSCPLLTSAERRLNFTAGHELGHVILGHPEIPEELKTEEEIAEEDLEADELAGRLLMPRDIIYSCNYYSVTAVAEYLMVSRSALWKRLNNLKRLDLLCSRPVPTCPCCGNTKFCFDAEYCGVCGTPVSQDLKGIRRMRHKEERATDSKLRFVVCPSCGFDHINGSRCAICGTYIYNICSDFFDRGTDGCAHVGDGTHRYCELCGKPTAIVRKHYALSWKDRILSGIPPKSEEISWVQRYNAGFRHTFSPAMFIGDYEYI